MKEFEQFKNRLIEKVLLKKIMSQPLETFKVSLCDEEKNAINKRICSI